MYGLTRFEFSRQHERLLRKTVVDEHGPGTVLHDHDHLYQFSYRNRFGAEEQVQHPYMDDGPWTSEVLIGDVPLGVGQTMTFLFDFGDMWRFGVTLESVDPEMAIEEPVVLEKHGNPPEQYEW